MVLVYGEVLTHNERCRAARSRADYWTVPHVSFRPITNSGPTELSRLRDKAAKSTLNEDRMPARCTVRKVVSSSSYILNPRWNVRISPIPTVVDIHHCSPTSSLTVPRNNCSQASFARLVSVVSSFAE